MEIENSVPSMLLNRYMSSIENGLSLATSPPKRALYIERNGDVLKCLRKL